MRRLFPLGKEVGASSVAASGAVGTLGAPAVVVPSLTTGDATRSTKAGLIRGKRHILILGAIISFGCSLYLLLQPKSWDTFKHYAKSGKRFSNATEVLMYRSIHETGQSITTRSLAFTGSEYRLKRFVPSCALNAFPLFKTLSLTYPQVEHLTLLRYLP